MFGYLQQVQAALEILNKVLQNGSCITDADHMVVTSGYAMSSPDFIGILT